MTQHFIVIGNPITHSKSPQIHHAFAKSVGLDINYQRQFCPTDPESFLAVVQAFFAGGGTGANVTLPFKEIAYDCCRQFGELSEEAARAKAVNTLMLKNGKLYGDNTDGQGLVADLTAKQVKLHNANVAIIGAGGATRGAILPLLNAGANLTIFNRSFDKVVALVAEFNNPALIAKELSELHTAPQFDLIINATSAITTNQTLDLTGAKACVAYDMMYGKPSAFLTHFANQQARTYDGYGMLISQAALSFTLWTGKAVDLSKVDLPK